MRLTALLAPAVVAGFLAGCGSDGASVDPRYGVKPSPRVVHSGPVRKGGGRYHVGKPYKIAGKWYHPQEDPNYRASGRASWYGDAFHGRLTANGEVFDMHGLSAAHPTLPLPSYVKVTNRANGHAVVVRVNDRGPFHGNRVIDVSRKVAELLDFKKQGIANVTVEYVDKARMDGQDDWLVTTATIHGEKMSRRQLASLGVDSKLLRQVPDAGPLTQIAARPATVAAPVALTQTASWPVAALAPAAPEGGSLGAFHPTGSTEVLIGAFSDKDNIAYVSEQLRAFGEVDMRPVSIGGQLLEHMSVHTGSPAAAEAALETARHLGATDARILYR